MLFGPDYLINETITYLFQPQRAVKKVTELLRAL